VAVAVVHADGVDLLFITFDAVRRTNVVTEEPCFTSLGGSTERVGGSTGEEGRADCCEISVDCVSLD